MTGTGYATDIVNAPEFPGWFEKTLEEASHAYFGREPLFMGKGGSIPFMNLLSRKFPEAKFMISGVLGPYSNAHGPMNFYIFQPLRS